MRWYGTEEPIPPWKTVDEAKLDSALNAARQAFGGVDMYPTLPEKAAVKLYSIAKAHALPNGNKRIALVTTLLFLALNGKWWDAESEEVRAHVTWIAASDARHRDKVLAYMTAYLETRCASFEDVMARTAANAQNNPRET